MSRLFPLRRREVLAGGLLIGAPSTLVQAAEPEMVPDIAIFDARYAPAQAFARAWSARGVPVYACDQDVARLWYGPVRRALAQGARPRLAGLTTYADVVVLSGCAAEARLAVTQAPAAEGLVAWIVR